MSKLTCIIIGMLVAVSVAVTVAIERRAANQQHVQTEALKEQAAQLAQANTENARLTNLVARATSSQALSPEQLRDLLRLRNEVGQLRKLEDQKAQLQAANARTREMETKSQEALARAQALPNYWPKEQLAFAGFAEPQSAVKSFLAAMKNGDLNAFKDCFDAVAQTQLEAELKKDGGDPAAKEAEIKSTLGDFMAAADGFHIVDTTPTASNEVTVNLSLDGPGQVMKFVLRKNGNEWKLFNGF